MKIFTHWFSSASRSVLWGRGLSLALGAGLLSAVVLLGPDKVSAAGTPWLVLAANILVAIFLLSVYLLVTLPQVRPFLSVVCPLITYVLGSCAWMYSILFVISALGFWGIFFCLLFQTLAPITFLGALFKGAWNVVGLLLFWQTAGFFMKIFNTRLAAELEREKEDSRIIDIEVVSKV